MSDRKKTRVTLRDQRAKLTSSEAAGANVFPERLLRDYEAAAMLGRSRAMFRDQVKRGELPQPARDGHMTFWRQSDLIRVIDRMFEGDEASL